MHDPFQNYANMLSAYGAAAPYGQGSPYGAPYSGALNPMGLPYNVQQAPAVNPLAAINPFAALGLSPQAGQMGYGLHPAQNFINPQQPINPQLQLAAALAAQAATPQLPGYSPQLPGYSPLAAGLQNPMLAAFLTNPLIAAGLHSQLAQVPQPSYPQFGQFGGSPFGQAGPTAGIGYPPAPQSWVGQGNQLGAGQGYGQIHPLLAQLTARANPGQGISPWGY
jgi:hypothetical protein